MVLSRGACSGTGEVARVIGTASFQPQAAAFTSLLHMCAKAKLWQKALEVRSHLLPLHPALLTKANSTLSSAAPHTCCCHRKTRVLPFADQHNGTSCMQHPSYFQRC